jgi:hypothetical protein
MMGRSTILVIILLVLSSGAEAAPVYPCKITVARYHLTGDAVNWSLRLPAGEGCIGGVRFNNVVIERLSIASPPRSGALELRGSGFVYTAPEKAQVSEDSFVLSVAGSVKRLPGQSTIHVSVSLLPSPMAQRGPANRRSEQGDANFIMDGAGGYLIDNGGRRLRAY